MNALERIKEIEKRIEFPAIYEPQSVVVLSVKELEFLLRAFREMREIAIGYSKAIDPDETKNVEALLNYEFEERMVVKCAGSGRTPCDNPENCQIPWHYNKAKETK